MAEYLLYCFDGFKLERCDRFEAPDDETAIAQAIARHSGKAAELWSNGRRMTNFAAERAKRFWPAPARAASSL
jgi:hypothetical protein